jgi:acyl-CoA dehydrogenase
MAKADKAAPQIESAFAASRLPLEWPFFDSSQREFASTFQPWVAAHLQEFEAEEGGDGSTAREIFRRLGQAGWLRATADGVDLRRVCLMREILGYSSAIADVALSEPWLAMLPIALYGSADQKRSYLEPYLTGRWLPAFALSEPEAGSDVAAIATSARPTEKGFVLDGRKTWTSNSGLADAYVVFARTEGESGAHGISAFVVDGDNPGVRLEERLRVLPPHTVGTLRFDACRVDASSLLGEAGEGFAIAMRVLEIFRPTVAAATVGFARRAFAEALERSTSRVAFRKPIGEHQLIQEKLADMAVKVDAAALLTYRAAWMHDTGRTSIAREASIAKLYCSEAAQEVVDQALQVFGGLGVTHGSTVERLYRHVRAFRIFDGTSEIQKLVIARHLLGGKAP